MSKAVKPSPVWHRLAREMAALGCTPDAIAEEFGEDIDTVRRVVGSDEAPAFRDGLTARDRDILHAFDRGLRLSAIGLAFGITRERVRQIAAANGRAPRRAKRAECGG